MKINTKNIKAVLKNVMKFSGKNSNGYLSKLVLEVKDKNKLSLMITHIGVAFTEMIFKQEMTIEDNKNSFKVAVELKQFNKIINKIKEEFFEIELIEENSVNYVKINFAENSFTLLGFETKIEIENNFQNKTKITFKKDFLDHVFSKTVNATHDENNRPILTGIHAVIKPESYAFAGTNAYILNLVRGNNDNYYSMDNSNNIDVIISGDIIKRYMKLNNINDDVEMYVSTKQKSFFLVTDDITIQGELIEGNFPEIEYLFPVEINTTIVADKKKILSKIDMATAILSTKDSPISIVKENDTAEIVARNEESFSNYKSEFSDHATGKDVEITLNPTFLKKTLDCVEDSVTFEISNPLKAITVRNDTDWVGLLTPMR